MSSTGNEAKRLPPARDRALRQIAAGKGIFGIRYDVLYGLKQRALVLGTEAFDANERRIYELTPKARDYLERFPA